MCDFRSNYDRDILIDYLAKKMATYQKLADEHFYIYGNVNMSSSILTYCDFIKRMAIHFNISEVMYERAYRIYDFRNSGRSEFHNEMKNKILKERKNNE